MDAGADVAAQPGLGLGARRRRPAPARQPPSEHHALRDVRVRGPPARRRGRQRPALRAPVRGARAWPSSPATSASPRTARASRTPTSWPRGSSPCSARAPAAEWIDALRAAAVPAGPINDVAEAFALAESLGMEPVREAGGYPLPAPPLRLDGERPPIRRPPPGLDEHGAELRAWLAGRSPVEPGHGCPAARSGRGPDDPRSSCPAARSAAGSPSGSMKRTSSRSTSNSATSSVPRARKKLDQALDELLRGARAGRDADDAGAVEPLLAHLELVVDQVRVGAGRARDVDEPVGVRRVASSRSRARGRTARPSA